MENCRFLFNVIYNDTSYEVAKMRVGEKITIMLINECVDHDGNENYSVAFGIEDINSIISGLSTYCDIAKILPDGWIWNNELYNMREILLE
jgi:hypothetical protein